MWCGGPSSKRLPGSIPAGYASQTGYQYDSISRVAGQREPAPPSNFSKLGGFRSRVFITDGMYGIPLRTSNNSSRNTHSTAFRRSAQARLFGYVLLENLSQLPGGLEQAQLGLLAGEIGIEKGNPLVVFVQAGLLNFLQGDAILVEFGLFGLKRFLRQLEIEAGHLPAGLQLAHAAGLLLDVKANLLALVAEQQLGFAQLTFCQRDVGRGLGGEYRNRNLHSHVQVIPLEVLIELVVVVEFT